MKQHLLLFSLAFLFKATFGQTISFDRGSGNKDNLATAVTVLELITQNNSDNYFITFPKNINQTALH